MPSVYGVDCSPALPDKVVVLDALGVVKFMDAKGSVRHWCFRSDNLTVVEGMGMTRLLDQQLEEEMFGGDFQYDDDDYEVDDDD